MMNEKNSIEKLLSALRQQFPVELNIFLTNGELLIRDDSIETGRGFQLRIAIEPRYFRATFEFEDYARQLIDHAAEQLVVKKHFLSEIAAKYPAFSGRIYRRTTEDIFESDSRQEDLWWVVFEYKIGDEELDRFTFVDILLFVLFFLFPYKGDGDEEGAEKDGISSFHERSRFNRSLCLAFHGFNCNACELNMRRTYRGLKSDYIHVHHLNPVATSGVVVPDPIRDMVPLCPNCHSVAHLRNPPYTVEEIKMMIKSDG